MSSYTKYHKKYEQKNKLALSRKRKHRYYYARYGIPPDLISEFLADRKYYIKLGMLNPAISILLLNTYHPNYNIKHNINETSDEKENITSVEGISCVCETEQVRKEKSLLHSWWRWINSLNL